MAEIIRMPKLSDTMTEGTVSKWLKKVGDKIKAGEILAEIDSDKATMEFESFYDGTLLYIGIPEKKSAPVNCILAIIGKEGEDISRIIEEEKSKQQGKTEVKAEPQKQELKETKSKREFIAEKKAEKISSRQIEKPAVYVSESMIKASPLAKKLAREKNLKLSLIAGSGEDGRITKRDIQNYLHYAAVSSNEKKHEYQESYTEEEVSQMRKTIAKRLAESKFSAPHFYLTVEINAEELIKVRETLNAVIPEDKRIKISFNDLIIKASASALREHPKVNSSWLGDRIRYNNHIHIGVAVAVEEGLLVPVVRFADTKTITQIAVEVKELAGKAKEKKLHPSDWEGNTFTISNLGMFGIEEFTAIINPPDACILAVGGIRQVPVVKDGKIAAGAVMKITLSCDHRAVDGATGAEFLQTLKTFLENPVLFLGAGSI